MKFPFRQLIDPFFIIFPPMVGFFTISRFHDLPSPRVPRRSGADAVAVCRGDRRAGFGHEFRGGFFHRDMMAVKQQHMYSIGMI